MYKVIDPTKTIDSHDFLDTVLDNREIENKDLFLNPLASQEIHYSRLHNMRLAVELFVKTLTSKEVVHIAILIDQDIDGFCSSAILVSYLEKLFPQIKIHLIFHDGKQHGLTEGIMKKIETMLDEVEIDMLITPDSSSSDYKHHKILSKKGIKIISLDHHECDNGESEFALVVNNQLSPDYSNKALSGVGVVYKFLQALDDEYGYMEAEKYLDLVALGNIADSMDLTSPETRYLVYEGLKDIRNEFLKEIITRLIGDFNRVYPQTLSFGVIPKMNGIIRVGKPEEKVDLFNAFRGLEEVSWNTRSKKNETLPQKVARQCINAHKRQKTLREKLLVGIREQIEEKSLNQNAFLLIELDETFERDLGGYLAGSLASDYRKPVLMMIWDNEKKNYSGSLRGFDGTMKNTKDFLEGLELFDYLGGHQNACGFKIQKPMFEKLNGTINSALEGKDLTGEQKIDIDFFLDEGQLTTELVEDVYSYEYLWGKGANKPLFAVEIEVDTNTIKKSASSTMIDWFYNGVKFVQFSGDRRLLDLMEDGHVVKLSVVGSLSINHFLGSKTPQFLIEDIAIGELLTEFTEIKEVKVDDLDDLFNW